MKTLGERKLVRVLGRRGLLCILVLGISLTAVTVQAISGEASVSELRLPPLEPSPVTRCCMPPEGKGERPTCVSSMAPEECRGLGGRPTFSCRVCGKLNVSGEADEELSTTEDGILFDDAPGCSSGDESAE